MTDTVEQTSVKILRKGPRGAKFTSDDAVSYEPEGCYVIPMRVVVDVELSEELEAWDAASDEALEAFEDDRPAE